MNKKTREATAREIDTEVRRLIDEQYLRVKRLLAEQSPELREAASVLLIKETITGEELRKILMPPSQKSLLATSDQLRSAARLDSMTQA